MRKAGVRYSVAVYVGLLFAGSLMPVGRVESAGFLQSQRMASAPVPYRADPMGSHRDDRRAIVFDRRDAHL